MKKKQFKSSEALESLRNDPVFRALVEDLKSQPPEDQERLGEWLHDQAEKEQSNGPDKEDS
jgi:hypothetical protein